MASSERDNICVQLVATSEKKIRRINFKWVIKNFSFFCEEHGKGFHSPEFALDGDNVFWKLKCYPRGNGESAKGCVSLFLESVQSRMAEIPAKFKVSVENNVRMAVITKFQTEEVVVFKNGQKSLGMKNLFSRSELLDQTKGWLKDDTLTVSCYVEYAAEDVSARAAVLTNMQQQGPNLISGNAVHPQKRPSSPFSRQNCAFKVLRSENSKYR